MAFTGFNFKESFDRRIDKSFSDYYNFDQERDFYKRIVQIALDRKYQTAIEQKKFDELRGVLGGNVTVPLNSTGKVFLQPIAITNFDFTAGVITTAFNHNALVGSVINYSIQGNTTLFSGSAAATAVTSNTITIPVTSPTETFVSGQLTTVGTITDYMHLFSAKVTYNIPSIFEVEGIQSDTNKIVIVFNRRTNYRDGQEVIVSGVLGATNANGTRYLRQVGTRRFQLYADKNLLIPVVGNNLYISGGAVSIAYTSKEIFQEKSDQINYVDEADYRFPRFKIQANAIVFEPAENIISTELNYMTLPKVNIDPENNETDLLLYYPEGMIQYFIDFGAQLFDLETRNPQGYNLDGNQVVTNP